MAEDRYLLTLAKMLRIALGYGSREARIKALMDHSDTSVSTMARILHFKGYLDKHTVKVRGEP